MLILLVDLGPDGDNAKLSPFMMQYSRIAGLKGSLILI